MEANGRRTRAGILDALTETNRRQLSETATETKSAKVVQNRASSAAAAALGPTEQIETKQTQEKRSPTSCFFASRAHQSPRAKSKASQRGPTDTRTREKGVRFWRQCPHITHFASRQCREESAPKDVVALACAFTGSGLALSARHETLISAALDSTKLKSTRKHCLYNFLRPSAAATVTEALPISCLCKN